MNVWVKMLGALAVGSVGGLLAERWTWWEPVDQQRATQETIIIPANVDANGQESTPVPLDEMLAHERQSHVRTGLKRLRSMDRETLVAFYIKGRSLCEMSNEFGSPIGTIKRRLHVARKRLAEKLQDLTAV